MPAKTKGQDGIGRSKLRFVMFDAEVSDDNLSELMGAITNALRPAAAMSARSIERPALKTTVDVTNAGAQQELPLDDVPDEDDGNEQELTAPRSTSVSRSAAKKVYKQPIVLDLDFKGDGVTFLDYVKRQAPTNDSRRYLVACGWFKDHGKHEMVDRNKMFTAYRTAGWPFANIKDWDVVFRNLRQQGLVRRLKPGEYEITTVGLGRLLTPEE